MAPKPYQIRVAPGACQGVSSDMEDGAKPTGTLAPFPERNVLDNLSPQHRTLFLSKCVHENFKKGANIFLAGQKHRATYFVESGLIRIYHLSMSGKEITIGYRSTNDMLGGPHFFDDDGPHVWSASAVKPSTALAISGRDLLSLVTSNRQIGEVVLGAISFKLVWDSLLLQILGTGSVSSRLAHLLYKLVMFYGVREEDEVTVTQVFTQEDLATMVGATRQWVSAQLKHFQAAGILQVQNRQIVIQDLNRLKDMCE